MTRDGKPRPWWNLGDQGQRYEVRFVRRDTPAEGYEVAGWTNNLENADRMAAFCKLRELPDLVTCRIVDRRNGNQTVKP